MGRVWTLLRKPSNRRLLSWFGGGGVVLAGGIWAVVTYVWPAHEAPTAVCAEQGIVIGLLSLGLWAAIWAAAASLMSSAGALR